MSQQKQVASSNEVPSCNIYNMDDYTSQDSQI